MVSAIISIIGSAHTKLFNERIPIQWTILLLLMQIQSSYFTFTVAIQCSFTHKCDHISSLKNFDNVKTCDYHCMTSCRRINLTMNTL